MKVLPVGPLPYEVRVGNEDARSKVVRGKNGDGFSGLHEQRLLVAKLFKLSDDGVETIPVARGLADATIDDEVGGALGYFRIEVVHQATESGLLLPAFAAQLVATWRANDGRYGNDGHECSGKGREKFDVHMKCTWNAAKKDTIAERDEGSQGIEGEIAPLA